jgi:adenylate cyclase
MQYSFAGFTLDAASGRLTGPSGSVTLRPKAAALLEVLVRNAGRPLRKEALLESVWRDVTVTEESLTQAIHELRRALGEPHQAMIRTMPRRGYQFDAIPPSTPVSDGRPALAVLGFENLSGDPSQGLFAAGLTSDLVAALSMIRQLEVRASGGPAFRDLPPADAAGQLRVRYLLSGGIRRSGDRLRVTAQLVDVQSDRQVWSERFDGAAEDVFAFQEEITRHVAVALQLRLTSGEYARLWDGQTKVLRAWEKLVQGRDAYWRWTEPDNRRARVLFEEALAIDPTYTTALVQLGMTWWIDARFYESYGAEHALAKAEETARAALAINAEFASAWTLLGAVAWLRSDFGQALDLCRKALALAPEDMAAQHFLAMIDLYTGDIAAADAGFAVSARLAALPLPWIVYYRAYAAALSGDFDAAAGFAAAYHADNPDEPWGWYMNAVWQGLSGRAEAASATVADLRARFPRFRLADIRRSQNFSDRGRLEAILEIFRRAGVPE